MQKSASIQPRTRSPKSVSRNLTVELCGDEVRIALTEAMQSRNRDDLQAPPPASSYAASFPPSRQSKTDQVLPNVACFWPKLRFPTEPARPKTREDGRWRFRARRTRRTPASPISFSSSRPCRRCETTPGPCSWSSTRRRTNTMN